MKLSVTIISKNEAGMIGKCLESVSFADEIVVVDSGSSDETVAICQSFGARVIETDWPGFGPQKNRALDLAGGEWVLSIDADETVSAELKAEIEKMINSANPYDVYRIPRSSSYCGREIRHCGWSPDYVVRLFKRGCARFSDDLVHEKLLATGEIGTLTAPLEHCAFESLEEVLEKVDRYSTAGAIMMQKKGRTATLPGAVLRGFWSFVRTYILRAGFLDGAEGFMLAVSNAEGTYYRYLKLMLLNRDRH